MSNQTIPEPGILPKKPRLSVCMIVCDEEDMLPRCLKSVQNIANELIVVDTGSKGNTVQIAEDFGAKVHHFKWCDDFAAARNESLKHATCDWILQIDADEELFPDSIPHLRKALFNPWCLLYEITCDNGATYPSQRFAPVGRIFRNHPRVRYHRPYHETVDPSVDNLILTEPRWRRQSKPEIIIRHYGYELSERETQKKIARGLRIMESYVQEIPDDAYVWIRLGEIYCHMRRYDKAIAAFRKAMDLHPNLAGWVHGNLAFAYYKEGFHDEAIAEYKKAMTLDPNLAQGHARLGAAHSSKGMLDEAITEHKKALAINPNLAQSHNNLGVAYGKKGMWHEAIIAFKNALTINPDYAEAHNNLAVAYYQRGDRTKAIKHCDRAMELGWRVHPHLLQLLKP